MTSKRIELKTWIGFEHTTVPEQKQTVESSTLSKLLGHGVSKINAGTQRTLLWPGPSKVAHWFGSLANLATTKNQSPTMTTTTSRWM
jgi:hypothetical protein